MKYIIPFLILLLTTPTYADITVDMLNKRDDGGKMVYSEDISRIDLGEMITWLPTDKGHNVEFIAGPEGFEIPKKSKLNKEYSMIFNVPGVYLYQCTPHKGLGMIALVVVGGDTSNKDDIANAKTFGKSKKILPDLINQL
tara:strand:+ start:617 stop:1036 length:420 start_codon:yes stop_codon:yes gene_type:complete